MPRRRNKERGQDGMSTQATRASNRAAVLCALLVFSICLVLYLLTIIPTVVDQDSGELVAAAHVLGIAHPTGYPLWTMLGRVFDFLPVGHTSAYRVALLSAVSAAAAAALIAWLAIHLSGLLLPGVFAGIAFGLWFPTWSQAVRAEVYALSGLLFALFLLALWKWNGERSPQRLYWLALAAGFVSMHHRTAFLAAAPALAAALWLTQPRRARAWVGAVAVFLEPFVCYLYLPIRAAAHPPMNWGNPDVLHRFTAHVLGRQYTGWAFMNPPGVVLEQAAKLLGEVLAGPGWLSLALGLAAVPLIVWGATYSCRRHPAVVGSLVGGCLLLSAWVLEWGETSDVKVFLLPLGAVAALFGGLGLARVSEVLGGRRSGAYLAAGLGALLCGILLAANWARSDQSDVWMHRDRWAAALAQMDENAIFLAGWDNPMFATYYLQNVEGLRTDITHLKPHGLWSDWYVGLIQDPELQSTADDLWRQTSGEFAISGPGTPELWQATALFAYRLAEHYRGTRTVYALHGPVTQLLPGPPHFVGLNENLMRLDFETPDVVRPADGEEAIAQFPGGVELVSFQFDRPEAETGELVGFRARWRLASPLSGALFAVRLVPAEDASAAWDRLSSKGLFVQGYHLLYALYGLPPCPPGTVCEQQGKLMVPTNAPPGKYTFEIGFAQSYPPHYTDWAPLRDDVALTVHRGTLPTNRP
jgi:hypothetical protein